MTVWKGSHEKGLGLQGINMPRKYDASTLKVLRGLDPVRQRPGMYTDTASPDHIVREAIDNGVDEAMGGHATTVSVQMNEDGSVTIEDDGRGMPVDIHPEEGVSGVELILTKLHSGGKFSEGDDSGYAIAGGLHGVGISVANALCEELSVEVKRDAKVWTLICRGGEPTKSLHVTGRCAKEKTGTKVTMRPDAKYFDTTEFDLRTMAKMLRAKALLCRGLRTRLVRNSGQSEDWYFEGGLNGVMEETLYDFETEPEKAWTQRCEGEKGKRVREMEWSMAWINDEAPPPAGPTESYVNLIPTPGGGSHVQGMRSGIARAIRAHIEHRGLGNAKTKVTADDASSRLRFIMSVHAHAPQFAGQTKERLSERAIAEEVERHFERELALWMARHTSSADKIAQCAIEAMNRRLKLRANAMRRRNTSGPRLPGKLTDCNGGQWEDTELFLVEGDSAGGSARQGRDRRTQAILPLRGKIKNTWEVETDQIAQSETVSDIIVALGVEPKARTCEGLRYAKICILADADSDGLHIATLLVGLFTKHFPALIGEGRLYVAQPPLYRIDAGKTVLYALDDGERKQIEEDLRRQGKRNINVQRFKGLGEMNPKQLRDTTLRPGQRRLKQITMENDEEATRRIDMLLAKRRSKERREWLEREGDRAVNNQ